MQARRINCTAAKKHILGACWQHYIRDGHNTTSLFTFLLCHINAIAFSWNDGRWNEALKIFLHAKLELARADKGYVHISIRRTKKKVIINRPKKGKRQIRKTMTQSKPNPFIVRCFKPRSSANLPLVSA